LAIVLPPSNPFRTPNPFVFLDYLNTFDDFSQQKNDDRFQTISGPLGQIRTLCWAGKMWLT
jgi:hypothetical protein